MYIVAYLLAVAAANLIVGIYGASAVLLVGFALIGFELVARDRLHDQLAQLGRRALVLGLLAVIVAGGGISYAIALLLGAGPDVGRVAIAGTVAFTVAALADSLTYAALRNAEPATRSALSNVPAALWDSLLFLSIAFPGPMPWLLFLAQFAVKALGGCAWALLLYRRTL